LSFAFLVPAALLAAAVLAGPLVAHLSRQPPRERVPFGAAMLLRRLPRDVSRRRRLRDRALLALRLLALALFVAASARPELRLPRAPAAIGGTGRVVVVLDDSMSMDQRVGASTALALAREQAAALVRSLPSGTQVVAISASSAHVPIVPAWESDLGAVAARVAAVEVTDLGTDLAGALNQARTLLGGQPGEVVAFTDEAGAGVVDACASELAGLARLGATLEARVVAPESPQNVAVADASYGEGVEGGAVKASLLNFGPSPREVTATVLLPDGARMAAFVELPAAGSEGPGHAEETFTVPRQAEGGVAAIEIEDGTLARDDRHYFHLPRVGSSRVMIVDGDPGSSPSRSEAYFLERALAPGGPGLALDVVAPLAMSRLAAGDYRVAWLLNVADPGPHAPALVDFVRGGGGLVLAMGDLVTPERYNGPLVSLLPAPLRRVRDLAPLDADAGAAVEPPTAAHALVQPLLGEARTGFARLRARRAMTLQPFEDSDELTTFLRFAGGIPALVGRRIGNGYVLCWTSTMDLGWGNFPVEGLYAPLAQRITTWLGGEAGAAAARIRATVGEAVRVPLAVPGPARVTGPSDEPVEASLAEGSVRFLPAAPGAYAVRGEGESILAWVAVNTPIAESDVRRGPSLLAVHHQVDPAATERRVALDAPVLAASGVAFAAAAILGRGLRRDRAS
jgi:hypothetical protein